MIISAFGLQEPSVKQSIPPWLGKGAGESDITAIRIWNLSKSTTDSNLQKLVEVFGPVSKIYLPKDKQTGRCKGFAFIHFKFKADAVRAIAALNEQEHDHLILIADWSKYQQIIRDSKRIASSLPESDGKKMENTNKSCNNDNKAIRISNLSEFTTAAIVNELVKPFGPVSKIYLAKNERTNQCRGYAHVHFEIKTDAIKAIAALNGYEHDCLILAVDWLKHQQKSAGSKHVASVLPEGNGKRVDNKNKSHNDDTSAIRISNLSESTTYSNLKYLLKQFGPTTKIYLAKDKKTDQCKGYAYVHFQFKSHAAKAVTALNGHEHDHLILSVDWSKS